MEYKISPSQKLQYIISIDSNYVYFSKLIRKDNNSNYFNRNHVEIPKEIVISFLEDSDNDYYFDINTTSRYFIGIKTFKGSNYFVFSFEQIHEGVYKGSKRNNMSTVVFFKDTYRQEIIDFLKLNLNNPKVESKDEVKKDNSRSDHIDAESSTVENFTKQSRKFQEILQQKLKVGNTRGAHLNSIPSASVSKIDLASIKDIDKEFPELLIKKLLNKKSFSLEISYDEDILSDINKHSDEDEKNKEVLNRIKKFGKINKRLNTIVYNSHNELNETGNSSLAIGYPIIVKQDSKNPSRFIKAPIFLWYLSIDQSSSKKNTWELKRDDTSPILINEILLNYLENESDGTLSFAPLKSIHEQMIDDNLLSFDEVKKFVNMFLGSLNISDNTSKDLLSSLTEANLSLLPGKDIVEEECKTEGSRLYNSAVLSSYKTFKQSILDDYNNLLEKGSIEIEDRVSDFNNNVITGINTDPTQRNAIEMLSRNDKIVIQGPPGTGKSQSLSALIINALINNANVLVVAEKRTALEVIYNRLKENGLEDLIAMIENPVRDRKKVIAKAREIIKKENHVKQIDRSIQSEKLSALIHNRSKVNAHHDFHKRKLLNNENYRSIVGSILKYNVPLQEKVSFNNIDFKFTKDEFNHIEHELESILPLANRIKNIKEVKLFNNKILEQGTSLNKEIKNLSITLFDSVEYIKTNINTFENESYDEAFEFFNSVFQEYETKIRSIFNQLTLFNSEEKQSLYNDTIFNKKRESFGQLFSAKLKKVKNLREKIDNTIIELLSAKDEYAFLNLIASNIEEDTVKGKLNILQKNLDILESEKSNSSKELALELVNKIKLNNVPSFLYKTTTITKALVDDVNELISFLNKYEYINWPTEESIETIFDVKTITESISKVISPLKDLSDDINDFKEWFRYMDEASKQLNVIVTELLGISPIDWKHIFTSWYRKELLKLEKDAENVLLTSDHQIDHLSQLEKLVQSYAKGNIKENRYRKLIKKIELFEDTFNIGFKVLYNLARNKKFKTLSLRKIIDYDYDLFTSIFPVVLTNPTTVSTIFPLKKDLFDVVIFDEASQLLVEDTYPSLIRGKIKIISGDKHQMPPSKYFAAGTNQYIEEDDEEFSKYEDDTLALKQSQLKNHNLLNLIASESLLEYANQKNYKETYLDIHYRSNNPDLIQFSNVAFYNNRLLSLPQKDNGKAIIFYQIDGVKEEDTNNKEAKAIIEKIKDIALEYKNKEENHYPSIGVATFNIHQRNLINDLIIDEKVNSPDFREFMEKFEKEGFFVKNLENIQGDEQDILLISITYGPKQDNSFSQRFASINRQDGYKLLNVLITRAKKKIYVFNSIPQKFINKYKTEIEKKGNDGKGILYAYLAYAKAVSDGDKKAVDYILNTLKSEENIDDQGEELYESVFEEEVYYAIKKNRPNLNVLLQVKDGGFRIDIVIKGNNVKLAIECDGATYHSSTEAYAWDVYRQDILEKHGYVFHRIWSPDWFYNENHAKDKLLKFIDKHIN